MRRQMEYMFAVQKGKADQEFEDNVNAIVARGWAIHSVQFIKDTMAVLFHREKNDA